MIKTATISDCGKYRYSLTRIWNEELPMCSFGMINPSTADANLDDPTIRKCIGFAARFGFGAFTVWNLFAWRSVDVKGLRATQDPIGPDNDDAIIRAISTSQKHYAAWGSKSKLPKGYDSRIDDVVHLLKEYGVRLHSIGVTKSGDPRHPLMTAYDTPVKVWEQS